MRLAPFNHPGCHQASDHRHLQWWSYQASRHP
nr:MAG TPA: hypothetical protein [Caudoviricetes sp.]